MVSHALSWVVSVLYDRCAIRMPVTRKQDLRGEHTEAQHRGECCRGSHSNLIAWDLRCLLTRPGGRCVKMQVDLLL